MRLLQCTQKATEREMHTSTKFDRQNKSTLILIGYSFQKWIQKLLHAMCALNEYEIKTLRDTEKCKTH